MRDSKMIFIYFISKKGVMSSPVADPDDSKCFTGFVKIMDPVPESVFNDKKKLIFIKYLFYQL